MFFGNIVIFFSLATLLGASAAIESKPSEHELEPQEVENLGPEAMITEVDAVLVAQSKGENITIIKC